MKTQTLVLQSSPPGTHKAIRRCLRSVEGWAAGNGFAYRHLDDALFEAVPRWAWTKFGAQRVVLSDLARLLWVKRLLDEGWPRVLWLDSDVFVFEPSEFSLPECGSLTGGVAFGREIWIQPDRRGGLAVRGNVHNAASLYERGNAFLDFYIHACLRILARHEPGSGAAPQILGPKFLGAQHNIVGFPLLEAVGMASPLVLAGVAGREGRPAEALEALREALGAPMHAVNLCLSYLDREIDGVRINARLFTSAMDALSREPRLLAPSRCGEAPLHSPGLTIKS
jgi:hypothetical protein